MSSRRGPTCTRVVLCLAGGASLLPASEAGNSPSLEPSIPSAQIEIDHAPSRFRLSYGDGGGATLERSGEWDHEFGIRLMSQMDPVPDADLEPLLGIGLGYGLYTDGPVAVTRASLLLSGGVGIAVEDGVLLDARLRVGTGIALIELPSASVSTGVDTVQTCWSSEFAVVAGLRRTDQFSLGLQLGYGGSYASADDSGTRTRLYTWDPVIAWTATARF